MIVKGMKARDARQQPVAVTRLISARTGNRCSHAQTVAVESASDSPTIRRVHMTKDKPVLHLTVR